MAQMANITVKKADGTTDIVYTALTPSAGDQTPARWSVLTDVAVAAHRIYAEMRSRFNGKRDARHVEVISKHPDVQKVDGRDVVMGTVPLTTTAVVPLQVTDAVIAEAVEQHSNLLRSALIREAVKQGYAPQ